MNVITCALYIRLSPIIFPVTAISTADVMDNVDIEKKKKIGKRDLRNSI